MDRVNVQPGPIYLDHHATTPVDPRVLDAMMAVLRDIPGNPNSVEHGFGRAAASVIERARGDVAALAGCEPEQIIFTCSASDAIGRALKIATQDRDDLRVAAMTVEHPAMLTALRALEGNGRISIEWLEVDGRGQLDPASLERALELGAGLVCMMAANNELGTVYPVGASIAAACQAGALSLVDASQAAGRLDLREIGLQADFLVLSAHKFYGPKGVGALLVQDPADVPPGLFGHEATPNVAAIAGMGTAARLALDLMDEERSLTMRLRDRLQGGLVAAVPGLIVNGDTQARLPHSLHISIPGVANDAILTRIGDKVAISTGSACASGAQEPSHVLRAVRLPESLTDSALRLSVGRFTTDTEIDFAVATIAQAAHAVRAAREERVVC